MNKSSNSLSILLELLILQLIVIYTLEVTDSISKLVLIILICSYVMYIFKNILNYKLNFKREVEKLVHIRHLQILFLLNALSILYILKMPLSKLMTELMAGWDFVGHFGVFRWGLSNFNTITSSELAEKSSIVSYLGSDYPQTWALWGGNLFRFIGNDQVTAMRSLLIFSILTISISYLVIYKSISDFILSNNNLHRNSKLIKIFLFAIIVYFLSFSYNSDSPHFALATAFMIRATLISQTKEHNFLNDFHTPILLLLAYILYPLVFLLSGLYFMNLFIFIKEVGISKTLRAWGFIFFNLFTYLPIVINLFVKNGREISFFKLVQSYGGVDFSKYVFLLIIFAVLILHILMRGAKFDLIKTAALIFPCFLLDAYLLHTQGFVAYYGAKLTVAFVPLFCIYIWTRYFLFGARFSFANFRFIYIAAFPLLVINIFIFHDKFDQISKDAYKASLFATFSRNTKEFEPKSGWISGKDLAIQVNASIGKDYYPLFTGGYPYLANMWLSIINYYPSEIWYDNLGSSNTPINPINFISKDNTSEELLYFSKKYSYITIIDSLDNGEEIIQQTN